MDETGLERAAWQLRGIALNAIELLKTAREARYCSDEEMAQEIEDFVSRLLKTQVPFKYKRAIVMHCLECGRAMQCVQRTSRTYCNDTCSKRYRRKTKKLQVANG